MLCAAVPTKRDAVTSRKVDVIGVGEEVPGHMMR
jgi:hypothetical protein